MKKIVLLKIQGCPYCAQAYKAIDQLKAEDKNFSAAEIEIIDENTQPELAEKFSDYYYVPSMYVDGKKIYEAHPGETYEECLANVRKVFQAAS